MISRRDDKIYLYNTIYVKYKMFYIFLLISKKLKISNYNIVIQYIIYVSEIKFDLKY